MHVLDNTTSHILSNAHPCQDERHKGNKSKRGKLGYLAYFTHHFTLYLCTFSIEQPVVVHDVDRQYNQANNA
jgi:hypothetical protein